MSDTADAGVGKRNFLLVKEENAVPKAVEMIEPEDITPVDLNHKYICFYKTDGSDWWSLNASIFDQPHQAAQDTMSTYGCSGTIKIKDMLVVKVKLP